MSKLCSVPKRHGSAASIVISIVAIILMALAVNHFWTSGKQMDTLTWVLIIPATILVIIIVRRER
jgi:uncharacterized membrane protein YdcZ (DUF606 family)